VARLTSLRTFVCLSLLAGFAAACGSDKTPPETTPGGQGGRGGNGGAARGGSGGNSPGTGGQPPGGTGGSAGGPGADAAPSETAPPDDPENLDAGPAFDATNLETGPLPPPGQSPGPGWTLRWNNEGAGRGLGGFEGQETAECTHAGAQHAMVMDGKIRIEMHYPADTDCKAGDRQRNEVKGMSQPGGGYVSMKKGETWLLTYSMFIPDTLDATTGFTHIHQIFGTVGTMATVGPVVTMSLHSHGGTDSIEMRIDGTSGDHWSPVPLAPMQNKWVTVEFEVKWDSPGTFRWTIRDETQVYVNANRTWNGWHGGERMRPKWGIYRKRDSAGLVNTYILLDNFKAYQR
jgi:hypothetical protein